VVNVIKSIVGGSANLGKDSACDSLGQPASVIQMLMLLDAIGQFYDLIEYCVPLTPSLALSKSFIGHEVSRCRSFAQKDMILGCLGRWSFSIWVNPGTMLGPRYKLGSSLRVL
jgi:hypothetical protein